MALSFGGQAKAAPQLGIRLFFRPAQRQQSVNSGLLISADFAQNSLHSRVNTVL
jgi:hypothetical protein